MASATTASLVDNGAVGLVQKRAACVTCSKSKRKCTKQLPACQRCRSKKIPCSYPPSPMLLSSMAQAFLEASAGDGSSAGVVHVRLDAASPPAVTTPPLSETSSAYVGNDPPTFHQNSILRRLNLNRQHVHPHSQSQAQSPSQSIPQQDIESWFLEPSSWDIDHVPAGTDCYITYPESGLEFYLSRMRHWLDQWTQGRNSPLFHSRLYGTDLPAPLQSAYAAWLAYSTATTPSTKKVALQMAQSWSKSLVQESALYDSLGEDSIPLLAHLARTQALVVYQFICLFDGDIRARAEAEAVSATVAKWASALLQRAGIQSCAPHATGPDPDTETDTDMTGQPINDPQIRELRSDGTIVSTWKAWILSESLRRTWVVAQLTECAYLILKQGSAMCPGSIGFTGRSGLWDAKSPREWQAGLKKKSTINVTVYARGLLVLLDEALPSDVDEFTVALLAYGSGREKIEDWLSSEA